MFDHSDIEKYDFEEVPLDRDIYLMGEEWIGDYEKALLDGLNGKEWTYPGFISYAAARYISADSIELSWYANIHTRFHEMRVHLPRSSFICCVGSENYDEKPRIFVKDDWLTDIHKRTNSVFAIVDADGVKAALTRGAISNGQLVDLRARLDDIAAANPNIAFVSFADSLLLKMNWSFGTWNDPTKAVYEPEQLLRVLPEIARSYQTVLHLQVYAVAAQGRNEFYGDDLMHVSPSKNHISLNSLGIPFAQLQAIEQAARSGVRRGDHAKATLYLDVQLFNSLRWKNTYDKGKERKHPYLAPMIAYGCNYVAVDLITTLERLEPPGTGTRELGSE